MRFTSKQIDKTEWHPWFAWYPVVVYYDSNKVWVWLEKVDRKRNYSSWWSYRLINTLEID